MLGKSRTIGQKRRMTQSVSGNRQLKLAAGQKRTRRMTVTQSVSEKPSPLPTHSNWSEENEEHGFKGIVWKIGN